MTRGSNPNTIVTLSLVYHDASELAVCLSQAGNRFLAEWFPKSQIDYDEEAEPGDTIDVQLPRWLLIKKGFDE
jgi:hypothetical protein